jgi:GDP-mannose transporter
MVTILKNMTNILTALGEIYVFRKGQNKQVWAALFMMVRSLLLFLLKLKSDKRRI